MISCVQVDQRTDVVLVLLDLSATFDTVDHWILLTRLSERYGIGGNALNWFRSYLSERKQSVTIGGKTSVVHDVDCGVPQGSVCGPFIFTLYTAPLEDVIASHGVKTMIYADDTQLYLTLRPSDRSEQLQRLEIVSVMSRLGQSQIGFFLTTARQKLFSSPPGIWLCIILSAKSWCCHGQSLKSHNSY